MGERGVVSNMRAFVRSSAADACATRRCWLLFVPPAPAAHDLSLALQTPAARGGVRPSLHTTPCGAKGLEAAGLCKDEAGGEPSAAGRKGGPRLSERRLPWGVGKNT